MKKSGPGGEWTLTVPTPFVFLVRFIKAEVPDQQLENMAHFLSELGMMHYATLMYCPSMVAASAVFAARCTLNKTPLWSDTLKLYTGYTQEQLMDCAGLLVSFHSNVGNGKLKVSIASSMNRSVQLNPLKSLVDECVRCYGDLETGKTLNDVVTGNYFVLATVFPSTKIVAFICGEDNGFTIMIGFI
ncbi:G2/mitotic-specific cyclin [Arachis hypogaea]|nr:G2/mitotic-specific cyclin [Arachis hypogaea]